MEGRGIGPLLDSLFALVHQGGNSVVRRLLVSLAHHSNTPLPANVPASFRVVGPTEQSSGSSRDPGDRGRETAASSPSPFEFAAAYEEFRADDRRRSVLRDPKEALRA